MIAALAMSKRNENVGNRASVSRVGDPAVVTTDLRCGAVRLLHLQPGPKLVELPTV
jgi:hypothetical protein